MARPSPADLLAYQLQNAGAGRTASKSPETPWLSDSHSSPASSPEIASGRKSSAAFKPREAVARKFLDDGDDEEDGEEYIGYGKPKRAPKESLMDLLSSDPPWSTNDVPLRPSPPHSKQSFGRKFLSRRRNGSSPAEPDADFRRPGTTRTPGIGGLRSTKSSASLPSPNFDDFALSLSPQTKRLVAKSSRGGGESTRDLAEFLRLSEPPSTYTTSSSSRGRASTVNSSDTASSGTAKFKPALRIGRPPKDLMEDQTELLSSTPETSSLGSASWKGSPWEQSSFSPTYESVSPLQVSRLTSDASMTRKASLVRTSSLSSDLPYAPRRMSVPRKPVPSPEELPISLPSPSPESSMSYISNSTLAIILGEDATEPVSLPRSQPRAGALRTVTGDPSTGSTDEPPLPAPQPVILKDSTTQTTPPRKKVSPRLTFRPATADGVAPASSSFNDDDAVHPQRQRTHTGSSQESSRMEQSRSLSPTSFRNRRPMSPAPDSPLPPPPGRSRPMSIAIQPTASAPLDLSAVQPNRNRAESPEVWSRPMSRPASTDSFVDPPLTRDSYRQSFASTNTLISSRDPIFIALRVLQQSMRQGAALRIPPSIFARDDDDANAGLTHGQLAALVPSLTAMHSQMLSTASLLEIVLERAQAVGASSVDDDAQDASTADFLLGGGEAPSHESQSQNGSHSASDSGIGEEAIEEKDEPQEARRDPAESTDDEVPLLVKHLSVQM